MNKIKFFYFFVLVLMGGVSACSYEDLTTYAGDSTPDILIDTVGIPVVHVISREQYLVIKPTVSRAGTPQDQFEYEWRITLNPGSDFKSAKVIGKEETLNYLVEEIPNASIYSLWYRVTDKTTGLMKSIMWKVQVEASSGQGLVVAYTKDEKTTDFAIVQDSMFTNQYYDTETQKVKPTFYRFGVFSKQNGKTFNGVVEWMFAQSRYMDKRLTYMLHGASKHNVFRFNTIDYSVLLEGKENFYDRFIEIDVDFYKMIGSFAVISNKGRLHGLPKEDTDAVVFNKFGVDVPGNYRTNSFISDYSNMAWFEPDKGKFYTTSGYITSYSGPPAMFTQALDEDGKPVGFDIDNMLGYEQLAAGQGKNEHCFVLKKNGKVGLYTLNKGVPRTPLRYMDISDAPGIERATSFVFAATYEDVIYYVADNAVNAIVFSSGIPRYKTNIYPIGESIGFIAMLKRSGSKAVPFDEKCLLVITNGNNGKIHALKLGSANSGEITGATVLEGFDGRITAVAVQD